MQNEMEDEIKAAQARAEARRERIDSLARNAEDAHKVADEVFPGNEESYMKAALFISIFEELCTPPPRPLGPVDIHMPLSKEKFLEFLKGECNECPDGESGKPEEEKGNNSAKAEQEDKDGKQEH